MKKESATEVAFVKERRNIDSPVARDIELRTAGFPPTPLLDLMVIHPFPTLRPYYTMEDFPTRTGDLTSIPQKRRCFVMKFMI
jgi:hypothetical protein